MTPLTEKIRNAALAYPGLTALLGGTNPNLFRWYQTQLKPSSAFPAVVALTVSNPSDYAFTYRMKTSFARVQLTVWALSPEDCASVEDQLEAFLDQMNLYGISGLVQNANFIVNARDGLYPETQPPQYQRIIDVKVFSNESVN